MARCMIRSLGFGAMCGAVAGTLASVSPERESPVQVLSEEIEAAKRFVEPFQGVLKQFSKGFKESVEGSEKAGFKNPAAAVLKLDAKAKTSVRSGSEGEKEKEATTPTAPPQPMDKERLAAPAAVQPKPAATAELPAAPAAPAVAAQAAGPKVAVEISAKERKKLWVLLSTMTAADMALLGKFTSESFFGPKLDQWCAKAAAEAECKYENGITQYLDLVRRAAPTMLDSATLSVVAQGILESQATPKLGKRQKQEPWPEAKPAATKLMQSIDESAPKDESGEEGEGDAALWEDLTSSEPFKKQVTVKCQSLKLAHPGCEEVAKEFIYVGAITKALLTLFTKEELAAKMISQFLKIPPAERQPVAQD